MAAFLVGRDDEGARVMERAHHLYLEASDPVGAARCAIWTGFGRFDMGELAQAIGWYSRAGKLLDCADRDCAERGYLLVPDVLQSLDSDTEAAYRTATTIAEIGERCTDADLVTFALHAQGGPGSGRDASRRAWRCWMRLWSRWSWASWPRRCSPD